MAAKVKRIIAWLREENPADAFDVGVHNWVGILLILAWFIAVPCIIVQLAQ